jgi:hypothetical protein
MDAAQADRAASAATPTVPMKVRRSMVVMTVESTRKLRRRHGC